MSNLRAGRVRQLIDSLKPRSAADRKREMREMSGQDTEYSPGEEPESKPLPADFLQKNPPKRDPLLVDGPWSSGPKSTKKPKPAKRGKPEDDDESADEPADVNGSY